MLNNSISGCCLLVALIAMVGCRRDELVSALSEKQIQFTVEQDGTKMHLGDDGVLYRESNDPAKWIVVDKVYDPAEFEKSYVTVDDKVFRVSPDNGKRYEVLRQFQEDFEDLPTGKAGLNEIIDEGRNRWGSFTLQSPRKSSVSEYVQLRNDLISGKSDFLDARLEVSPEQHVSGKVALRCEAPARSNSMVTCKASLSSPLVYFKNGDDFWYEAYYYIEGSFPLTLADLECEFVKNHPGIRLRFYDTNVLGVELKALEKPQFEQALSEPIRFPKNCWVRVRAHFHLSAFDGYIEVWQDDQKIIDTAGMTIPFPATIYNSLEIGASAFSETDGKSVVFVDDVRVSDRPFE